MTGWLNDLYGQKAEKKPLTQSDLDKIKRELEKNSIPVKRNDKGEPVYQTPKKNLGRELGFDRAQYQRNYMREYMRRRRARAKENRDAV